MLHLHVVLLNWTYVPQWVLQAEWLRVSGAFVVNIKAVEGERDKVARYVARYVSRELASTDVVKCVTYSRGFPRLPALDKVWRISGEVVEHVPAAKLLGELGGCLVVRDRGCACLDGVRSLGLNGHMALRRIQERGPP
jgi:hypothetical protein